MSGKHCVETWQGAVALSSAEAELHAMVAASAEVLGIIGLCRDIGMQMTGEILADSSAALGAHAKQRSPNLAVNDVVREIALDLAEGKYHVEVHTHLPGWCHLDSRSASTCATPGICALLLAGRKIQSGVMRALLRLLQG